MIKRIVHIEKITMIGQIRQFQIKLPKDSKRLLQLHATTNIAIELTEEQSRVFAPDAGWLWLRLSSFQDVFYTDVLKCPLDNHSQSFDGFPIADFGNGVFWTQGKKTEFFELSTQLDLNLIEGYYVDRTGLGLGLSYDLKIYLTIEV